MHVQLCSDTLYSQQLIPIQFPPDKCLFYALKAIPEQ